MRIDSAWALVSGFFLLGTLAAVVLGSAGFLFLSGYHAGLTQCPKPVLRQ